MRRAVIATVGTVAAVVAILQYKSGSFRAGGGAPLEPSGSSATTSTPASGSAGSPSTTTPAASAGADGQFTGSDVTFQYGDIEARVTFKDDKITAVDFPVDSAPDPRSQEINDAALPILTQELLSAQSLHIDGVSGATYTSNAFAETVQAALSKAGKG